MSKSRTASELLTTQLNADETIKDNSSNATETESSPKTLIDYEEIKGTPFTLVHKDEKYFIAMGDYRLTEPDKTREAALDRLEDEQWMIITLVITICIEKYNKYQAAMIDADIKRRLHENDPHEFSEEKILNKIKNQQ